MASAEEIKKTIQDMFKEMMSGNSVLGEQDAYTVKGHIVDSKRPHVRLRDSYFTAINGADFVYIEVGG